jgi:molecular chaperone DnaK
MFADNKLLGNFRLDGIDPAPRGQPQIEVTFDIDANGILHVSAADKQSGKEQKISIEGSSGLSEDEIERAKKEAEENAEADKRRVEEVDTKNSADNLVFQVEKQLEEMGDQVPAELKSSIEEKVTAVKDALKADDIAAIKSAHEELEKTLGELAQAAQAAGGGAGGEMPDMSAGGGDDSGSDDESEPRKAKGKVVDAEEVESNDSKD